MCPATGANNIGRPARIARDEAVRERHYHQRPADPLGRAPILDTYYFRKMSLADPAPVMVPADSYESLLPKPS